MAHIKVISYSEASGKLKNIYLDLIDKRGKLANVHTIQSLNPDSIIAHTELYMTVMFSHSPISRANREMLAVVVSAANGCNYCQQHHGAALNNYWKNSERVEQLKRNYLLADLTEKEKLLCNYAIELTMYPDDFETTDRTQVLKEAGFDDRCILDATLVIAYFNFVNRIVLSLGVTLEDDGGEGYKM